MGKTIIDINSSAKDLRKVGDYGGFAALCKEHSIPEEKQDQFWNRMIEDLTPPVKESANEKLRCELKEFKGGQKERAVSSHVAKTLKSFCENENFAFAVVSCKKTLSDCVSEIMKGVGGSISDIEVYRRTAKFYFPGATVTFSMKIIVGGTAMQTGEAVSGSGRKGKKSAKKPAEPMNIQLTLFDGSL